MGETDFYQQEGGLKTVPFPKPHPTPPHPAPGRMPLHMNNFHSPQKTWCLSCKRGVARLDPAGPETERKGAGHNHYKNDTIIKNRIPQKRVRTY